MFSQGFFPVLCLLNVGVQCDIINFEDRGAIADDFGLETAWTNGRIMNETLSSLEPG